MRIRCKLLWVARIAMSVIGLALLALGVTSYFVRPVYGSVTTDGATLWSFSAMRGYLEYGKIDFKGESADRQQRATAFKASWPDGWFAGFHFHGLPPDFLGAARQSAWYTSMSGPPTGSGLSWVMDSVRLPSYVVLPLAVILAGVPWARPTWRAYKRSKTPAHACAACTYDLRGSLDSAVCPECGTAISEEQKEKIKAAVEGP